MKKLQIEVRVIDSKIATAIRTNGYDNKDISHQFELLGILENLKGVIKERIKKLGDTGVRKVED